MTLQKKSTFNILVVHSNTFLKRKKNKWYRWWIMVQHACVWLLMSLNVYVGKIFIYQSHLSRRYWASGLRVWGVLGAVRGHLLCWAASCLWPKAPSSYNSSHYSPNGPISSMLSQRHASIIFTALQGCVSNPFSFFPFILHAFSDVFVLFHWITPSSNSLLTALWC